MRLPPQPYERIDRTKQYSFTFEGRPVHAYEGDTLGSALYAAGRRVFARSFKYHRPRGVTTADGHCWNCLMQVDGVPNVRVFAEPALPGVRVEAQNVIGSLERDWMAIVDKIGGPFTPPGFYYKTFIRPRRFWPLYERLLRHAAGLGRLDKRARTNERFDVEHRHAEVLVVGGGRAGLDAALAAAGKGRSVVVVDEGPEAGGLLLQDREGVAEARSLVEQARAQGVEVIAPAQAIGLYEGNLVPVAHGNLLLRFRADEVVVATGAFQQPLVFAGNDLVGTLLPCGVRRLVNWWSLKPGNRAVVLTVDEQGLAAAQDLRAAGVEVAEVVDFRERTPSSVVATGRGGRLRAVEIDGKRIECDLLVMGGSPQPNYQLLAMAGATVRFDAGRGVFVPTELPPGVSAVGACAGDLGSVAVPPPILGEAARKKKAFIDFCEDQTVKDLAYAIAEGYDSIQLAKRYTTVTMGPSQGKESHLNAVRVYALETHTSEGEIGTTTARPPWAPVRMGLLAGRPHEPARRTSMHHRHKDLGARIFWTGAWRRPHSYGEDVHAEAQKVHESLGVIDVSTLGKILVQGPDAGAFLDRLYPNRFSDLKVGRIRYGILTSDAGRIFDDGTVARLADDAYYVTTTSTGADGVHQWFLWWNAVWQLDVRVTNVTGAVAAINVAGPNARKLMEGVCDVDVSNEAFPYLDAQRAHVAGVPALVLRIGFVGELGYEIHFTSPFGEHVWDTLLEEGAAWSIAPFGLEPQRILRLEKQHILVGQDTDGESNPLEAAMAWIVKTDKDDFVGKWAIEHVQERGLRSLLVGFEMPNGRIPVEGAQVVVDGRSAGRVTSVRWSAELGKVIGMAVVPIELANEGSRFDVRIDGALEQAVVRTRPFFDPDGARLRS